MKSSLARQHLIDPDICIRCNTCEETCPVKAITHDKRNYVVDFDKCDSCGDCLPPCPTGAIDSWRKVREPWSIEAQLGWDSLPADQAPEEGTTAESTPEDVAVLEQKASSGTRGPAPPPWSAAHPYIGLYSRERPATATVVGNLRLTEESSDTDIRHIVLDFGKTAFPVLEGQTLGVVVPGLDADGRPQSVRLYSVASPRDGERPRHNNLAITVKRVTVDLDGKPVRGLASGYLCDLKKGDAVAVTGPFGANFLMPNHAGSNLLMICTGTGSAPMRAMTERRRRRLALEEGGKVLLFFGARKPEELPYFGPLMKLPEELIDVELAFSRVPNMPKEYVQDRMRARAADLAEWLASDETYLFVCGHKRMEAGVLEALADVSRRAGLDWPSLAEKMRAEGRLHIETY